MLSSQAGLCHSFCLCLRLRCSKENPCLYAGERAHLFSATAFSVVILHTVALI